MLPEGWDRDRLSRTLAVTGGLMGAAPGLIAAGSNVAAGKDVMEDQFFQEPKPPGQAGTASAAAEYPSRAPASPYAKAAEALEQRLAGEIEVSPQLKQAIGTQTGYDVLWDPTSIPINQFRHGRGCHSGVSIPDPLPVEGWQRAVWKDWSLPNILVGRKRPAAPGDIEYLYASSSLRRRPAHYPVGLPGFVRHRCIACAAVLRVHNRPCTCT